MTGQDKFLKKIVDALDAAGIKYMITGSVSSSFHGNPRATNDTDMVITPTMEQLNLFVKSLKDCYVCLPTAREALKTGGMFNVIDNETGYKADMIICKNDPFGRQEFQRRYRVSILGLDVWVVSAEDIILSKLKWTKGRLSEKQFGDIKGIMAAQQDTLDKDYLHKWAKELGVEDTLKQLLEEASGPL